MTWFVSCHLSYRDEEHLYFTQLFSFLIFNLNTDLERNLDILELSCFFFPLNLPIFDKNGQINGYLWVTYLFAHIMIRRSVHIVRSPFEKVGFSNRIGFLMIRKAKFILRLSKKGVIKG